MKRYDLIATNKDGFKEVLNSSVWLHDYEVEYKQKEYNGFLKPGSNTKSIKLVLHDSKNREVK